MSGGQLAALLALGAFHGLNPGMGWLFAVALGFQERSRDAVLNALPPIAAGHLASVSAVAVVIEVTGSQVTTSVLTIGGGALLVAFGLWRLLSTRHFRWAGMRLGRGQLTAWSFLMSSVHGAGLMLLPVLARDHELAGTGHPDHAASGAVGDALIASMVHTAAMVAVMAAIALVVYHVLGLGFLRRAWINLDRVWAVTLIAAGVSTAVFA